MTPFAPVFGRAVRLDRANVDTGEILPLRAGATLFQDVRDADPAFPVAASGNPPVLLAGANFGCGSPRSEATRALRDSGFRCLLAPSFGPYLPTLAARSGLLAVCLTERGCEAVHLAVAGKRPVGVDLERQEVRLAEQVYRFEYDPFLRRLLLQGMAPLDLTSGLLAKIETFEDATKYLRPWSGVTA